MHFASAQITQRETRGNKNVIGHTPLFQTPLSPTVENQIMYLCHDIGIPKSQFEEIRKHRA